MIELQWLQGVEKENEFSFRVGNFVLWSKVKDKFRAETQRNLILNIWEIDFTPKYVLPTLFPNESEARLLSFQAKIILTVLRIQIVDIS